MSRTVMIMHPQTQISLTYLERQKCYGPDKKILFKKTIIWPWGQRSRSHEGHYGMQHTTLWSCTHIPIIIDLSWKTKMVWPGQENAIWKTIIWSWGQRSRSHEGHYGTQHTALWSCIYELSVHESPIVQYSPLLPPVGVWTVSQFQCGWSSSQTS